MRAQGVTLRTLLVLLLCSACCSAAQVKRAIDRAESESAVVEEPLVLTGEELAQAIIFAIKQQKAKKEVERRVEAQIIELAPSAELANGDGDVATTGAPPGTHARCAHAGPAQWPAWRYQ